MSDVQPIPDGYRGVIPHLVVDDCAAAIDFYVRAFGAAESSRMPIEDGRILHAELRVDGAVFFLNDDFPEYAAPGAARPPKSVGGTSLALHRYVADVDAAYQQALDAGAATVMPPADMFWGDRYCQVVDPFGHVWSLATHIADLSPEQMAAAMAAMAEPGGDG